MPIILNMMPCEIYSLTRIQWILSFNGQIPQKDHGRGYGGCYYENDVSYE